MPRPLRLSDLRPCLIGFLILVMIHGLSFAAPPPATLQVSQLVTEAPAIVSYLGVRDEAGEPVTGIQATQLQATVGAEVASVSTLTPFSETGEGVTYLFAVDISRSIVGQRFEQLKAALREWIDAMEPEDHAGLMTFGSEVRMLTAPTEDRDALTAAVDALEPTDQQTQLHAALLRGLSQSQQRIEGLPARRALVVMSDGLNDDPGGVNADEVLARLDEGSVPIYGVFFSALRDRTQREAGLAVLGRFARQSGGVLIDAGGGDPAAALGSARERIRSVYHAALDCAACGWDGNRYRVQLTWTGDGLTLSDGMDARLYPLPAGISPSEGASADEDADAAGEEASTVDGDAAEGNAEDESSTDDRAEGNGTADASASEADATDEAGSAAAADANAADPQGFGASLPVWWPWAAGGAGGLFLLLLALLLWLSDRRRRAAAVAQEKDTQATDDPASTLDEAMATTVRYPAPADELGPETQRLPAEADPSAAPAVPATHAVHLIGMSRAVSGQTFQLNLPPAAVLGRRSECALSLVQDDLVSGRHAELRLQDQRVLIADLGSTNQTFVNGVAIHAPHPLVDGDVLRIGQSEFRIQIRRLENEPAQGAF